MELLKYSCTEHFAKRTSPLDISSMHVVNIRGAVSGGPGKMFLFPSMANISTYNKEVCDGFVPKKITGIKPVDKHK